MPNLNKLLNKVNQATQALKSAKGIKSKIESAGYKGGVNTEEVDKLQEQAEENRRKLEERRAGLQKQLSSANKTQSKAKKTPANPAIDLQYPVDGDFDNFIVFETRPRKKRAGGNYLTENTFSIALYMPEDISQLSSVAWAGQEVGTTAREANKLIDDGVSGGGIMDAVKNKMGEMFAGGADKMSGGISNLKQGMAANPMKEQMLEGIDFRSHSFDWEFMPRSHDEAIMVTQIINIFRLAMLPDTFAAQEDSPNENFFNYPNIFDVSLDGPIAENVEGFLPMVLKEMTVETFGGNSEALLGKDKEMFAASTTMKLEFAEIKIMSQEVYMDKVSAPRWRDVPEGNRSGGSPSILDSSTGG